MKIIIDIRESYEYKRGHIEGSINITKDLLELVPEKYLNKNNLYILYCDKGTHSQELSTKLNNKGYRTISLQGGYLKYKNNV